MNQSQKIKPSPTPLANKALEKSSTTLLMNVYEFFDQLLYRLMGDFGRIIYASIQDAIVLIILLKVPSLIGGMIWHKNFSNFSACLAENAWGSSRYACFIIVTADFLLWIVLAGRIIARFWTEFKKLSKQKQ